MSYGDYVEQLTYLLFLKMADERSKPPYNQKSSITSGYDWQGLLTSKTSRSSKVAGVRGNAPINVESQHVNGEK